MSRVSPAMLRQRAQATVPGLLHAPQIRRLHYAVEALRRPGAPFVLQFIAAEAGDGTTAVARAFAETVAFEAREAVLLVGSAGEPDRPTLVDVARAGLPLAAAERRIAGSGNLVEARLASDLHPLFGLAADELESLVQRMRGEHTISVIDSPSPARTPESLALSRFCDGSVLVVRADGTPAQAAEGLRQAIERMGGQVIGAVLNRHRPALPGWLARLA